MQRARWARAAVPVAQPRRMPFTKTISTPTVGRSAAAYTAKVYEFPTAPSVQVRAECQPLAAHWFVSKRGRTLSDRAIYLLRLKGWLEICLADPHFEEQVYVTECRLREQAAYIIGDGA